MKIIHLYHSGVLLETDSCQVFIDVISEIDHLINRHKQQYFFVTHAHQDHFDQSIFRYQMLGAYYVLSDDILSGVPPGLQHLLRVMPNKSYSIGEVVVKTFGSTDQGVSFWIEFSDLHVFHAGDLNWWHWENDQMEVQEQEADAFKGVIEQLPSTVIDIVFMPCDPRLGDAMTWSIEYMLSRKQVAYMVPIHFRSHFEVCDSLKRKLHGDTRIINVDHCEQVILEL